MIALVDCNNFYVSCERLFNPGLEHEPVVVLSNNDSCVIARSQEAKNMGIIMGTPAYMIQETLEGVHVFSSNYTLYGDLSARVMSVLANFSETIENYSIDESFIELQGNEMMDWQRLAGDIRFAIWQQIGIPVSVGVAPTKTLAKLASHYAKSRPAGVMEITGAGIAACLAKTPVEEIWGIGRQQVSLLRLRGIDTALKLSEAREAWVRKLLGVTGQRLQLELRGISCIALDTKVSHKKNICISRGFGKPLVDRKTIREAVASYATDCAQKLRQQEGCAGSVNVFIQTNVFKPTDQQYYRSVNLNFSTPTNSSMELVKQALRGLDIIFRPGLNYNKAGVTVMDISPQTAVQTSLFDTCNREKEGRVMNAVDGVNKPGHKNLVKLAVQGSGLRWKPRREMLSPCYTTRLSDVIKINK